MGFQPAITENYKGSFNIVSPTTITFDHQCYSYEIRSDDGDYYVEENEVATVGSFRIRQGHTSERIIPCQFISILGVSGVGLCEIKTVVLHQGISDERVYDYFLTESKKR